MRTWIGCKAEIVDKVWPNDIHLIVSTMHLMKTIIPFFFQVCLVSKLPSITVPCFTDVTFFLAEVRTFYLPGDQNYRDNFRGCGAGFFTGSKVVWRFLDELLNIHFRGSINISPAHSTPSPFLYPLSFKGISRGPQALQSHLNDFYHINVLYWP